MENVRYRVATTTRRSKGSSHETMATTANAVVSGRQAPPAGDCENYHTGRRQRSRRRDVYAVPDDIVRVSTLSPPGPHVIDADGSDIHAKSPPFWAQPTFAGGNRTVARSRSRPRPPLFVDREVQRGEISGEYARGALDSSRSQQHRLMEESHRLQQQRQHQRQQKQHHAAGLNPSVNFATHCVVDCRPQVRPSPTSPLSYRTVTSPTQRPLSPSHLNDNKTLLKEALISAAAAKLARSSSARSAVVKPLVVVRNGPTKWSSDEHVDADPDVTTTTTTMVKLPLSSDRQESSVTVEPPEHTTDVAVATAAAAAATATRRSRTRRRDADQVTISSGVTPSAVSGTSLADSAGTRTTRAANCDATVGNQLSQGSVVVSSAASEVKMHNSAGFRGTRPVDCGSSPSAAIRTSSSSNCELANDSRRAATPRCEPGIVSARMTHVPETVNKTQQTGCNAGDNKRDQQQSTRDTPTTNWDTKRVDKTNNDSRVTERETKSIATDAGTHQESPSSSSKVSFIKTILSRARSPSPNRRRRSRSSVLHTSPSPSSVRRFGAEVAQRISEPVKGYFRQLRDRSSQRRRPADPATTNTTKTADEPAPPSCQLDRELATVEDSQPTPTDSRPSSGLVAGCNNRSTDDMTSRSRGFRTDRKKEDNGTSALTSQWKSTSELTTPMSRLDNLLKANSLKHLLTSTNTNRPAVDETSDKSSSTSSALPLLTKTSQSTGCLLSQPASTEVQHQQATERQRTATMSRCYLEKPPRVTRRAVTVQLDRRAADRQTPSVGVAERQSTSETDLLNPQPACVPSPSEEPAHSMKHSDVSRQSTDEKTPDSTTSVHWHQLRAGNEAASSQNERDLRELYEQKRLERQLEEKLALMEKERADVIAKLWSQIDNRCEANRTTAQSTAAVGDQFRNNSSSSSRLVLPLSHNTTSPAESNNQVIRRVLNRNDHEEIQTRAGLSGN